MIRRTLKGLLVVWLLSGCQPAEDKLVITGSSTISLIIGIILNKCGKGAGIIKNGYRFLLICSTGIKQTFRSKSYLISI